jgi:hypothetical protein
MGVRRTGRSKLPGLREHFQNTPHDYSVLEQRSAALNLSPQP